MNDVLKQPTAKIIRTFHCAPNETVEIIWRLDDGTDYYERHDCPPKFVIEERRKKEEEKKNERTPE